MEDHRAEKVVQQAEKTAESVKRAAAEATHTSLGDQTKPDHKTQHGAGSSAAADTPTKGAVHEFSKLQSSITELINSGYIQNVLQLRDTLMDQEWCNEQRRQATREGIAKFERYVAEKDMVKQLGGYSVMTQLYDKPDTLDSVLSDDKLKMLARSMVEESMLQRHQEVLKTCREHAKEMASLTNQQVPGGVVGHGILGAAAGLWGVLRSKIPVLKLIK